MQRRRFFQSCAALAASAAVLSPAPARAAGFPNRPIRLISPTAPGGMADLLPRLYADRMASFLGQPVIVENMPGAGTLLASRHVARAAPDGHVLLVAANTVVTLPLLADNAGYESGDFVGIGEFAQSPSFLVVANDSPIKSIAELVAAAKRSPGKISYASGGHGTTSHLPVELFARNADIRFHHVPYKSRSQAIPDIIEGRVEFTMGPTTAMAELIKSGKMRALAITSNSRSPAYPDVPTFRELGFPDATYTVFLGVLAPAGTPQDAREILAGALEAAKKDRELHDRIIGMGQDISDLRTSAQFDAFLRQEEARYRELIRETDIMAQS